MGIGGRGQAIVTGGKDVGKGADQALARVREVHRRVRGRERDPMSRVGRSGVRANPAVRFSSHERLASSAPPAPFTAATR